MTISSPEIKQRMAHFEQVCRTSGIKLTHQRIEIFREVAQTGDHPSAEMVYRGVRKRMPTVSLDTVYRTLWLLKDLDLVTMLESAHEKARFDARLSLHHHFVCMSCGLTQDLNCKEFDNLKPPKSAKALGQALITHVEVRGICFKCAEKEKTTSDKTGR